MRLQPTMDPIPKLLGLLLILQFGDVQGAICECVGCEVVNGQCLTFNKGPLNWTEAKNKCASVDGGRLAQFVDTKAAYEHIKDNMRLHKIWYAIGATDCGQEGSWKWIDGHIFVPKPWRWGVQPNNVHDNSLWVSYISSTNWGYDDSDYAYTGGYICEITQPLATAANTKETTRQPKTTQPLATAANTKETTRQPKTTFPYPYVCEDKELIIKCDLGYVIKVKNPSENGQRVVNDKCNNQRSCTVPASSPIVGDQCKGTYKNREVNHTCERPDINTVEDYESVYDLNITNETERMIRRAIINKTIVNVKHHNERYGNGTTYKQALNHLSYLTYDEVINEMTGAIVPHDARRKRSAHLQYYQPKDDGNEPAYLNWVDMGVVNPIRDQQKCNSCWAFSATSVIESQIMIKNGVLQQLSEQYLLDCDTGIHNHGCKGGWSSSAIDYVIGKGIALASEYPYNTQNGICDITAPKTSFEVSKSEQIIKPEHDDHLLNANFHIGPISVCIHVPKNFIEYSGEIYADEECNLKEVNHCLVLVGYGTENYHKYWLLRNSWSTDWGENGYMKLSRNISNNCHISSHAAFPVAIEVHSWTELSRGCIMDHDYILVNNTPTLADCKEKCENENGFTCRSVVYHNSTRICHLNVANRISGSYSKQCHRRNEEILYAERIFEHSWSDKTLGCLWGHDDKTLNTPTFEVCKDKCQKEIEFVCRSIDYLHSTGECKLSTSNSTSGWYIRPCQSPYEETRYAERIFDVRDEISNLSEPGKLPGGDCKYLYKPVGNACVCIHGMFEGECIPHWSQRTNRPCFDDPVCHDETTAIYATLRIRGNCQAWIKPYCRYTCGVVPCY